MKWMIRVDMEGLTGVVQMNQVVPDAPYYSFGLQMLKHDLEAVIDGLLLEPEDEVILYDIHFYGINVAFTDLDPRVSVICGKPHYTAANLAYLSGGFDGMILLGLHAKSGTPNALLNHNYEHDIRMMKVNGQVVGEIGLEAMIAGEADVPLVMVTGDDKGNEEALELLPNVLTATVKKSLGDTSALCYSPAATGELLRSTASKCREKASQMKPLAVAGPIELEMTFCPGLLLNKLHERIHEAFVAPDRILLKGDSVLNAWNQYLVAKT